MTDHSIAEARVDIKKVLDDRAGITVATAIAEPLRPIWKRAQPIAAALVMVALLAAALTRSVTRPAPPMPEPVSRFIITPPATAPLADLPAGYDIAISPDGKRLAYVARDPQTTHVALYVRDLDGLSAKAVPGTEVQRGGGTVNPFFSPDGQWLGFSSPGKGIMRVSVSGEPPLKIADDPSPYFGGGAWASDNTLIYSSGSALWRVSTAGGGTPKELAPAMPGTVQTDPVALPGGQAVLFTLTKRHTECIAVLNLKTGKQEMLIEDGAHASYARTGDIVFVRGTTLMAVPFDLDRLAVKGQSVALLQGIRRLWIHAANYALSNTGTLVYVPVEGAEGALSAAAIQTSDIVVVQNWFKELKRRMSTKPTTARALTWPRWRPLPSVGSKQKC